MNRKYIRLMASAAIAASFLFTPIQPVPDAAHAAVAKLDTIQVGLILESGKLKSAVPNVTLSSAEGLAITLRTVSGGMLWPEGSASTTTLKSAADQYGVKLLETADFSKAQALKDLIVKQYPAAAITRYERAGQPVYKVTAGGYATEAEAQGALTALSLQSAVAALSDHPSVQGPMYWSAGTFGTLAEAEKRRAELAQAGIDGDLAVAPAAAGGLQVSVWIGAAANNEGLQSVKLNALKQLPSLQLNSVDSGKPYVLKREDVTSSANGSDGVIPLFLFAPQGIKLEAAAKKGEVSVKEKSGRTYRGVIEVSLHNKKLAVINELPFEQYLYSVVSNEMGKGWPQEALKAQAVAARTYALQSGLKYEIAHVSDTTLDQAYNGEEDSDSIQAVDATQGEVLLYKGELITAFFSSNAGGMSTNGGDVWGRALPYLKIAPSPDEGAAESKALWKRASLPDGQVAYIHSSYLKPTGEANPAGLPIEEIAGKDVNARAAPYVDNANNPPVAKLQTGDRVTVFDEVKESNAYSWLRGPYSPSKLLQDMNKVLKEENRIAGPLLSLLVTERGESGRATKITANGKVIQVSSPDAYRSVFGGLPSTRFEIERSGGYTIQGANGTADSSGGGTLYAISGSGQKQAVSSTHYFVLKGDGKVGYASRETQFTFRGNGYGHGMGMSQWGARGLAELGYDYTKILSYYYEGVTLTKE